MDTLSGQKNEYVDVIRHFKITLPVEFNLVSTGTVTMWRHLETHFSINVASTQMNLGGMDMELMFEKLLERHKSNKDIAEFLEWKMSDKKNGNDKSTNNEDPLACLMKEGIYKNGSYFHFEGRER